MNWNDAFWLLQSNRVSQAYLVSLAWGQAAESRNEALLSNLHCNMLNPSGVCMAMDAAGVPIPADALPLIPKSTEARHVRASS